MSIFHDSLDSLGAVITPSPGTAFTQVIAGSPELTHLGSDDSFSRYSNLEAHQVHHSDIHLTGKDHLHTPDSLEEHGHQVYSGHLHHNHLLFPELDACDCFHCQVQLPETDVTEPQESVAHSTPALRTGSETP